MRGETGLTEADIESPVTTKNKDIEDSWVHYDVEMLENERC